MTLLAALASQLDKAGRRQIRLAFLDILDGLQHQPRSNLLQILAVENFISPETLNLPAEAIATIARSIIAVCTEWRWL
jgi:hypothetical protein